MYSRTLGDFIGFEESLENEFKEFTLRSETISLDFEKLERTVRKGIFPENFNTIILRNLQNYFQIYVPKYISAFANCEELEEGFLYFGVNDIGEITGIPFSGELKESDLLPFMEKIKTSLSLEYPGNMEFLDDLFSEIKLEVISLELNQESLPDETEEEITLYKDRYETYCRDFKVFREEQQKWNEEITSFTTKISYMMLDRSVRKKIANYLLENHPERKKVADILDSDTRIEVLNGLQLNDYRNDLDSVYYWIMFYKDLNIQGIRVKKPIRPAYVHGDFEHLYGEYFKLLTKLRNKFMTNNSTCTYSLIKMRIPGRKGMDVFYRHPTCEWKWIFKIRSIGIGGPCCI